MRHSAAHVLAQVVLQLFPEGKIAIGPPIDTGFYYDFDLPRALTPDDLKEIERRMRREMKRNHRFVWSEVEVADARERFADQPFKLELIDQFQAPTPTRSASAPTPTSPTSAAAGMFGRPARSGRSS